jgi:hypothetical protein
METTFLWGMGPFDSVYQTKRGSGKVAHVEKPDLTHQKYHLKPKGSTK